MVQNLSGLAAELYEGVKSAPIVSPHGHCDPRWFAYDGAFPDPASLLVIPDHYVFRMLYSQGVPLEALGIGVSEDVRNSRAIFRAFAKLWPLFLGTPSRLWMSYVLQETLGIATPLSEDSADAIYDQIDAQLKQPAFRPRALFDRFNIEVLATTDSALDPLHDHQTIKDSGWTGTVIPTFRPDGVLDATDPEFLRNLNAFEAAFNVDLGTFDRYLAALRARRAHFAEMGATATDHAIEVVGATQMMP